MRRSIVSRLKSRAGLLSEFARFLWEQRLVWLVPLVLLLLVVGGLLIFAGQPVVGPFIYTLF